MATLLAAGLFAFGAVAALPAPNTAPTKPELKSFLEQSHDLHGTPGPDVLMVAPAAGSAVMAAAAQASGQTPAKAPTKAEAEAVNQIVALMSGATLDKNGVTHGLAMGIGPLPAIPAVAELDHATAQAVVAAFSRPAGMAAAEHAQIAAAASTDPAYDERLGLVRTLYRVDGTDALIRHFVATEHMKLVIGEVNNHIEIAKLSDSDKYRLSAIAAAAETELEESILNMNARVQAMQMSKPEILQLITAYDSDAQRKLTTQRLGDTGKLDRTLDLDINIAALQIVKQFEAE